MNQTDIGWMITAVWTGNPESVGTGQGMRESNETAANYEEGVIDHDGSVVVPVRFHIVESEIPLEKRVQWRSFDEHGFPVYDGTVNIDWLYHGEQVAGFEYDHPAYNINRWNRESIGALIVLYSASDIVRVCPELSGFVEKHKHIDDEGFLANSEINPAEWLALFT